MAAKRILVDAREFIPGKTTGIGRFLTSLLDALCHFPLPVEIVLAAHLPHAVPEELARHSRVSIKKIPASFLASEMSLARLGRDEVDLFISPYPKLPIRKLRCPTVHVVHDVLYLTHPVYGRGLKYLLDRYRLQKALEQAALSWFVSECSRKETLVLIGTTGRNPRVRPNAIDEAFSKHFTTDNTEFFDKFSIAPGYILVVGNGLPHKNLGVLLKTAARFSRHLVFTGVDRGRARAWQKKYPEANCSWIERADDLDLHALIRNAFCLAQPSTAEGYGYPPLEAMAAGVPAVVSDISVLQETTGGHALFASPDDSQSWLEAIALLQEKKFYDLQVKKGRDWVKPLLGRQGWAKHLNDLDELLK
jgi:glycosyltransferase involved in cell wall biosynthesis